MTFGPARACENPTMRPPSGKRKMLVLKQFWFGSKRKMLILKHFAPARTCQNHRGGCRRKPPSVKRKMLILKQFWDWLKTESVYFTAFRPHAAPAPVHPVRPPPHFGPPHLGTPAHGRIIGLFRLRNSRPVLHQNRTPEHPRHTDTRDPRHPGSRIPNPGSCIPRCPGSCIPRGAIVGWDISN